MDRNETVSKLTRFDYVMELMDQIKPNNFKSTRTTY